MNMGSWGGLIAIVLLAALSMYTMLMLLRVRRIVSAQTGNNSVTYPDIARYVFGKPGAVLAYSLTMFASMGVAGAYIVFVASTLHSLVSFVLRHKQLECMLLTCRHSTVAQGNSDRFLLADGPCGYPVGTA